MSSTMQRLSGLWNKFQAPQLEDSAIVRLFSSSANAGGPARRDRNTIAHQQDSCSPPYLPQRRLCRVPGGGTYSAREVAEGFCIGRDRLKQLIESGALRAKRLQRSGKLRISSDADRRFCSRASTRDSLVAVLKEIAMAPRHPRKRALSGSLGSSLRFTEEPAQLGGTRNIAPEIRLVITSPSSFRTNRCIGCWTSTLIWSICRNA